MVTRDLPIGDIRSVYSAGVCVGCGGCEVATRGAVQVQWDDCGRPQVDLREAGAADVNAASKVCPLSDYSPNETEIAAQLWPGLVPEEGIGRVLAVYAGRVADPDLLAGSGSGGLTTYLLAQLLKSGLVDGVIHAGPDAESLFSYQVSRSPEDLLGRRKSRYFALSFAQVVNDIRASGQTYAFVGLPCAVRSLRSIALADPELGSSIKFFVGLVCGHTKSHAYAQLLAWQMGVAPEDLGSIDFRVKVAGNSSKQYNVAAASRSGNRVESDTARLLGGSWGHGMMQLRGCNFCDDIFAETADIVFGDAWLPRYESDARGTNVVVVRNELLRKLVVEGVQRSEVELEGLSPDELRKSQAGNFRHRVVGLSVRLFDEESAGRWAPRKRVAPGSHRPGRRREAIIRQRRALTEASHELFLQAKRGADIQVFLTGMQPLVQKYEKFAKPSFLARAIRKGRGIWWSTINSARRGRA